MQWLYLVRQDVEDLLRRCLRPRGRVSDFIQDGEEVSCAAAQDDERKIAAVSNDGYGGEFSFHDASPTALSAYVSNPHLDAALSADFVLTTRFPLLAMLVLSAVQEVSYQQAVHGGASRLAGKKRARRSGGVAPQGFRWAGGQRDGVQIGRQSPGDGGHK
eukprot:8702866-Pyramimonas_sp.AAC.1